MSKTESLSRYNLIIKKLRKHSSTFKEIADSLAIESELSEYNFNVSKRTFLRDLNDIRLIYNIDIQYDYSKRVYFIDKEQQPEVNERILEAFDTFNALNISDRLSNYIYFEKKKPQGTENLHGLLHAIKNQLVVSFLYQKYWENVITKRIVEPYALKEFKNRWYVLGKDQKDDHVKNFALDRLTDLDFTKSRFKYPDDFKVEEYYKYCFGIIGSNGQEPQDIILSFVPIQGKYIKSLPLYCNQEELIDNDKEFRIKLKLCITQDFIMELLSHGESVKVIEPKSLINDLKAIYQNALNQY